MAYLSTHDEILAYVRELYDEALDESRRLAERVRAGEISIDAYLRESTRVNGMREAYVGVMAALGEVV